MIVTRFAPSPTGYLHLGHAFAALTAARAAEAGGGRFLLRMENIDRDRCREAFEAAICEDLHWLGLSWEEPVLRQSERMDAYARALAALQGRGLLYPCFCTRGDIALQIARATDAPHGPEGPVYPGTCRALSESERQEKMQSGAPFAMRLDMMKAVGEAGPLAFEEQGHGPGGERGRMAVEAKRFGDIVLARKDIPTSYHLAVVVDDAFQQVTLVTRGNDLFAATHVQRLLQALLDLPAPAYAHHRLILDETGRKFSKRDHAVTLRSLRESGATPENIHAAIQQSCDRRR